LFFVDDDDIGDPFELELLQCALESGRMDVVSSYVAYFDTKDPPASIANIASSLDRRKPNGMEPVPNFGFLGGIPGLGIFRNVFGPSRFMIRAAMVHAAGPFHEEWGVGREDHEYLARLEMMGAVIGVIPRALFAKRGSGGSGAPTMTHTMERMHAFQVALRPFIAALSRNIRSLDLPDGMPPSNEAAFSASHGQEFSTWLELSQPLLD